MRHTKTIACAGLFFMFMLAWCCPSRAASDTAVADINTLWGTPSRESTTARPANLIPVPLVRQGRDNTCGVACVQSVLRYAGYEFDVREDLLLEPLKVKEDGTPFQPMADFLNGVRRGDDENDAPVFSAALRENLTIADLTAAIDAGNPVICLIQAWGANDSGEYELRRDYAGKWDSGHYVVAVGYDAERIYCMDPSTLGNYTYIPRAELDARWHGLGEITPEGIEYFEHAGIVVSITDPKHLPDEFHKIL